MGELRWCPACGDAVAELVLDGRCALCVEVEARAAARFGAAMTAMAQRTIGQCADALHGEDLQRIAAAVETERQGGRAPLHEREELVGWLVEGRKGVRQDE